MTTKNVSFSPVSAIPNSEKEVAPELRKDGEGKDRPIFKIKLLRGRHVDRQGKFNAADKGPHNAFPSGRFATRVFQADVRKGVFPEFESTVDLAGPEYNPKGYAPKFERVGPVASAPAPNPMERRTGETVAAYIERVQRLSAEMIKNAKDTQSTELSSVDKMTDVQLVEYCEQYEIDYSSAKPGDVNALKALVKNYIKGK